MNTKACVICGPSGVGKGTLLRRLMHEYPNTFAVAVSHTTRKPRSGETDGIEYNFITKEAFEKKIQREHFLEYLIYAGNYYGTSVTAIDDVHKKGLICILDIAVEAAERVKNMELNANY